MANDLRQVALDGVDAQAKAIMHLIAHEEANSRSEIARSLGLAPSTVSLRVAELEQRGLIFEAGVGNSSGGRRPRMLRLRESQGFALVAELGGQHARIGRVDLSGKLVSTNTVRIDTASGPVSTLRVVADAMHDLAKAGEPTEGNLRGIGIALPGPVPPQGGGVELASRMPGWQGFSVLEALREEFDVHVAVDNDANLMALGEHYAHPAALNHSITVKAGTAIGSGVIVNGALYRGATGAAGDVTHTRIAAAANVPCSCGNTGCLETVASGAGLVRQLREHGIDVTTTRDVLALTRNSDPLATTLVRTAGGYLGEVLSTVVNFFNPDALFITGGMASCEPFIAALRGRIYEGCHPLVTRELRIESATTGPDAALLGAARLVLQDISLTELG